MRLSQETLLKENTIWYLPSSFRSKKPDTIFLLPSGFALMKKFPYFMRRSVKELSNGDQYMFKNKFLVLNIIIIIVIITIASILILFKLGANSLRDWDEAIYAQVAREMVSSGDWLTPHYNFQPWFEKPPLLMWITATLFSIFKINEFWSRAASAFSGILLALVTYLIGKKAFNIRVGVLASITLLSNYEYLWRSRNGTTDMMLSLFIYLSVLAYLYARKEKRYWYGIGIFFSLAFMTKSWAASVIPIILLITLILDAKLKETILSKHFWGSILLSLVIIIPWHLSMLLLHFKTFIDRYVIFDLFNRSTSGLEGNVGTPMYYFDWIIDVFSPWFILIPFGLVNSLRDYIKKDRRTKPPILIILVLVILGLYSFLIQTKLKWYVTPVYPALCILISCMIVQAFDSYKSFAFSGLICSIFIALLMVTRQKIILFAMFLFIFFILIIWILYSIGRTRSYLDTFRSKLNMFTSINRMEKIESKFFNKNPRIVLFSRTLVLIITIFFIGSSFSQAIQTSWPRFLYIPTFSPLAEISTIAGNTNPNEPIICLSDSNIDNMGGPTVLFYSNRPLLIARSPEELESYLEHKDVQEIILTQQEMESLSTKYDFLVYDDIPPLVYAKINK